MSTETDQPYVVEEIMTILKEAVEVSLQNSVYQHKLVPQWTQSVIDHSIKKISELNNKSYKYIVNCLIFQKTGAGFHTATSCLWDQSNDGTTSYRWENKSMYCITSVYGVKI